jgi:hypothetical protein
VKALPGGCPGPPCPETALACRLCTKSRRVRVPHTPLIHFSPIGRYIYIPATVPPAPRPERGSPCRARPPRTVAPRRPCSCCFGWSARPPQR